MRVCARMYRVPTKKRWADPSRRQHDFPGFPRVRHINVRCLSDRESQALLRHVARSAARTARLPRRRLPRALPNASRSLSSISGPPFRRCGFGRASIIAATAAATTTVGRSGLTGRGARRLDAPGLGGAMGVLNVGLCILSGFGGGIHVFCNDMLQIRLIMKAICARYKCLKLLNVESARYLLQIPRSKENKKHHFDVSRHA